MSTTPNVASPGEVFNFASHLLELNTGRGEKTAFTDDTGTLTYADLATGVRQMAAALSARDIRREERVFLLMHDCVDWPVSFLGAMYAGIVPVAANTLLTTDEYVYMLKHSRAQAALVSAALLPRLREVLDQGEHEVSLVIVSNPDGELREGEITFAEFIAASGDSTVAAATSPDDPGFWLYSSGSTGRPKGTLHTHANPYWTAELYGKGVLGIRESDVCYSAAKLFFAYGLGNALSFPLSVGASVILQAGRPTPEAVFDCWVNKQPTVFFGAPTGYAGMLAHPDKPGRADIHLRLASSAGEALPAEICRRFAEEYGVDVVDGIGSTEMLHIFLSNVPGDIRYGTTGWPVPGYEIRLVGDDGGPVASGDPGDLYVKGPSAALMYWNNREKSRETFQGEWTKSGDKYILNEDGTYTYSGRTDDMLKVSGIYVSPFEVEACLIQHEAVLEAAVVGKIDDQGLTKTKAFVVLKSGAEATEDELKNFVKERLAPYKYPRLIEFVEDLPKTATGKIQRFRLREKENPTA